MATQLEGDLEIEVLTSGYGQISLPSHEVDELAEECDIVSRVDPESPDFKDGKVVRLIEKLVRTGDRLFSCHDRWAESVKRGERPLEPKFENEMKDLCKKYVETCDLTIKYIESLGVEKKDVLKKMDFGIVIYKIAKIYYGWKTPKLYALPGMRDQVIGGESANKFMEFIEKGRAQKMAAQAN